MSGRGWLVFALAWLLAPLVWLLLPDGSENVDPDDAPEIPTPSVVVDGPTVIGDTAFARRYGAADATAEEDLQAVAGVLGDAVLLVKDIDRFPLPDNAAFTTFLQGKNPHQVAWIAPGHPAVSGDGELLDRWGTPLFFHRESSRRTGLRSAGPDREMWTDDDVVWPAEP